MSILSSYFTTQVSLRKREFRSDVTKYAVVLVSFYFQNVSSSLGVLYGKETYALCEDKVCPSETEHQRINSLGFL